MNTAEADGRTILAEANRARQEGRGAEAVPLLQQLLARQPQLPAAWNLLGILQLEGGQIGQAADSFRKAAELDPEPPLWLNLANAQRALGEHDAELHSLEQALARDPYYLPAVLAKGEALIALGREPEALGLYRLLFDGLGAASDFPPQITAKIERARALLEASGDAQMRHFSQVLADVAAAHDGADLSRATAYAENKAGKRKVYQQRPTGPHFPYLPAIEFFDRGLFSWFEQLEKQTDAIREELLSLWADDDPRFRPYVAYPPGTPANQWAELNHSTRWSAWFFWENGERNDAHCERCPRTAAAIEQVPLLDIQGKAPTAMFSVLQPRTRIPPHTGTSNSRVTIHLPLVVPAGCGFRVGAETREWREGEAWAFDDTIEHEAWNDSDSPRAILIIDSWNPLLSEAEREVIRRIG